MDKWEKLLLQLDQVFGFEDKQKSSFKKISQHYVENSNEHVVMIEYRVRQNKHFVNQFKVKYADKSLAEYVDEVNGK